MRKVAVFAIFGVLFTALAGVSEALARRLGPQLSRVAAVCRHGQRAPIASYPTDPYKDIKWVNGRGGLVPAAVNDELRLGADLRLRYGHLLRYGGRSVRVVSSDRNRTIESAKLMMKTLLPGESPLMLPEIEVIPRREDFVLNLITSGSCPALISGLTRQITSSSALKSLIPPLLDIARTKAGMDKPVPYDLGIVYDTLNVQSNLGLVLPSWAHDPVPGHKVTALEALRSFHSAVLGLQGAADLRRISAGGMLLRLLESVTERSAPALTFFSAHDITLAALESSLGAYSGSQLPTSSCILLEVYTDPLSGLQSGLFLQRNGGTDQVRQMQTECPGRGPAGRTRLCPLDRLRHHLTWLPDSIEQVKRECAQVEI